MIMTYREDDKMTMSRNVVFVFTQGELSIDSIICLSVFKCYRDVFPQNIQPSTFYNASKFRHDFMVDISQRRGL